MNLLSRIESVVLVSNDCRDSRPINVPITLTGIGFFDVPHAQGAAANEIEIHPVLDITFSNTQKLNE